MHGRHRVRVVPHVFRGPAGRGERFEDASRADEQFPVGRRVQERLVQAAGRGGDVRQVLVQDAVAESSAQQPRADLRIPGSRQPFDRMDATPLLYPPGHVEDRAFGVGLGGQERDHGVERELFQRPEEHQEVTVSLVAAGAEHRDRGLHRFAPRSAHREPARDTAQPLSRKIPGPQGCDQRIGETDRRHPGQSVLQPSQAPGMGAFRQIGPGQPLELVRDGLYVWFGGLFGPEMMRLHAVHDHAGHDDFAGRGLLIGQRSAAVGPGIHAVQGAEGQRVGEESGLAVDGVGVPLAGRHRPGRLPPFLMFITP